MHILHLEDSGPDAELTSMMLMANWPDCFISVASNGSQFEEALGQNSYDLIISDYTLKDIDGLSALDMARVTCPETPFIFFSGTIGEERAIDALKRGASDYVIKDRPSRLIPSIRQALARVEENRMLRETEGALRRNQELFQKIARHVVDIIIMLDRACEGVYCNFAYEEVVGHPLDEHRFNLWADIHERDRATLRQTLGACLKSGESHLIHFRIVRPDGDTRSVEAQCSAVRGDDGHVTELLILARDMTERIVNERRLERQAALLNMAKDAILVRDEHDRLLYWNQGASMLYGWGNTDMTGRHLGDYCVEDPEVLEKIRTEAKRKGGWQGEIEQTTSNGKELIVQSRWSLVPASDLGGEASYLVINTDISEQKRLEGLLLNAQRMESIGFLAGGVAHDLNNILVPIIYNAELLKNESQTELERHRSLQVLHKSALQGADLVRQLVAFAKGGALRARSIDLGAQVTDFVDFIQQAMPGDIVVRHDIPKGRLMVKGDEIQIKQVLINLCFNARDALPGGGEIVLSLRQVLVPEKEATVMGLKAEGAYVVLSVADSGEGMSPEVQRRIFDPFFTTKESGSGMGLAAVLGIVKGHGGVISVESRMGQGSVFSIHLPLDNQSASRSPILPGASQGVLLVNDYEMVRKAMETVLQRKGFDTRSSTFAQAVDTYARDKSRIGLVLMDFNLNWEDELQVLKQLREESLSLPVVILSDNPELQAKAIELGAEFLEKPASIEALCNVLQSAMIK